MPDERDCMALAEVAIKLGSGSYDERSIAIQLIRKMGDLGCIKALAKVIECLGRGSYDERRVASIAIEVLDHCKKTCI